MDTAKSEELSSAPLSIDKSASTSSDSFPLPGRGLHLFLPLDSSSIFTLHFKSDPFPFHSFIFVGRHVSRSLAELLCAQPISI